MWKTTRTPSLEKIESEYLPDMMADTEEMYRLKQVISELPELDRALIIEYADIASMAKTGKKFSVSAATIYTHIERIRKEIKERL